MSEGLLDYPGVLLVLSFVLLRTATWAGRRLLGPREQLEGEVREDFNTVQTATLTVLALLIGFCFSMAVSRYDQRKILEEAEANAIGTEYLRADLLLDGDAAKVRGLLRDYLKQRILFCTLRDGGELAAVNARTAALHAELWSAVLPTARAQPTPPVALAVAGMNDVLNSEGYTQAAWWNRIPPAAWTLLFAIAVCGTMMIGYGLRKRSAERVILMLPFVVSVSFFLIADIDSPRGGMIHVKPANLQRLIDALPPP